MSDQHEHSGGGDPWAPPEAKVSLGKSGEPAPGAAPDGGTRDGEGPPPPAAPTGPYDPFAHGAAQAPGPGGFPYPPAGHGVPPYGPPPGAGYGHLHGHGHPYGAPFPGYGYGWPKRPANGLGVAALVLGIVGTVLFVTNFLAIVLGTLAIVFGALGRGRAVRGEATNGGQATAGLVLGAVAIVLAVGVVIVLLAVGAGNHAPDDDRPSSSFSLSFTDDLGAPRDARR